MHAATYSAQARLAPIVALAHEGGFELDPDVLSNEKAAEQLYRNHGLLPTIGCEVEIVWSSLFPEIAKEFFGQKNDAGVFERTYKDLSPYEQEHLDCLCQDLDSQLRPRYEATARMGIPVGNDAYWEFANSPAHHWKTLVKEIELLEKHGLIPINFQHSTHVTLGGLALKNGGPSLIITGLELMEVAPERITSSHNQNSAKTTWARRGRDGLRHRNAQVLGLGQNVGFEMRTLAISDHRQAGRIFEAAQMLGAALSAYRAPETSTEIQAELKDVWKNYRGVIRSVLGRCDLAQESWGNPQWNPEPWAFWAECLRRRDEGAEFETNATEQIKNQIARASAIIFDN